MAKKKAAKRGKKAPAKRAASRADSAFVNLSTGTLPTEDLSEELAWHTRALVGEQVVFKSVKFRRFLPGAKDRKAMRRILRADALEIPTNVSITIAD